MKVYENDFCRIIWDEANAFMYVKWQDNNVWHKDESEYRKYFELYVQQVEHYQAINVVHDMLEARYTISLENQAWTVNEMFPRLVKAGLKRVSLLVSSEFITNLSVEQVITDAENSGIVFETRYFTNKQDSIDWMLGEETKVIIKW